MKRKALILASALLPATAAGFEGGGGSLWIGTGWPSTVDAASNLAEQLAVRDHTGNWAAGVQGFYQGDRHRLGGAFQAHAWGGVNPGRHGADEDAAGVAAFVGGLYGTWTWKRDRTLLNVGAIVGAGRCYLGYSLGSDAVEEESNVATFFLEPHVSAGVATCRWFGLEFQLSVPVFLLTEDLALTVADRTHVVTSGDLTGIDFRLKLTAGKIAELP